jgi:hypothetical protein
MTVETYRARWIDAAGQVVRDETFEADVETFENAAFIRPEKRIALALDAPYFYPDLRPLNEHLEGYIGQLVCGPDVMIIVNDDGRLIDGWRPNPHPVVDAWARSTPPWNAPVYGPVVLVERAGMGAPPEASSTEDYAAEPVPQPVPDGTVGIFLLALGGRPVDAWLTGYDPDATQPGSNRTGIIDASPNIRKALRFRDAAEAYRYVMQVSRVMPLRPDGEPNRPLTAFTMSIERLPEDPP